MTRDTTMSFHGIPCTFSQLSQLLHTSQKEYPWSVHIGHDLISIAAYRQWRGVGASLLHAFLASFHFGNGGTPITNMVMGWNGGAHPLVASSNQAWVWLCAFAAVYKSPFDFVYRVLTTAKHPARVVCLLLDQIDAITSMVNVMDKGMLILSSGAVFNHVEALSLGRPSKYPWAELNQTIRRKLAFVCMYFLAMRYRCRDQVRWWLTLVSLAATFCTEALSIDPLSVCDDFVCKALAR